MDCGDKCAKWLLFVFNFIFFLSGIVIITLGAIVTADDPDYVSLLGSDNFFTLSIVMIVIGCIVTIVSFFGCCGALKNNTCMLYTFSVLLTIIFLLELVGAILAFVYQDQINSNVSDSLTETFTDACTDPNYFSEWEDMQQSLQCCGVQGPDDWKKCYSGDYFPPSCCVSDSSCNNDSFDLNKEGCFTKVNNDLSSYAWYIAGGALAGAIIQLFGIGIACCLAHSIRRQNKIH